MDSKFQALFLGLNCLDCKGFKRLLDTQSLVDCTLACEGGKISAHKLVLSACSSYLAKILHEHPVEHPIIILPELNIEDVKTLVHYMYTGELLKSNTVNSMSLLRTAAILSINSLNDLLLASSSASPGALFNSYSLAGATNNNNINSSINGPPSSILHLQQDRMSLVDQISPLLAAISQHQQQQQQQQQQQKLEHTYQSNQTLGATGDGAGSGSLSLNQNENIGRNLSTSSHDSNSSTSSSNFSNVIGATGPNVAADGGGASSAMAQFYNTLTGATTSATNAANLNSSSSSSTSPSASQQSINNNNAVKTDFGVPEPFSYSSAITGMVTVTNTNSGNNSNGSQTSAGSATTNEFQFKCPVCHHHFQTICSFEYHMQRAHSVTSFGCEICHKPFASLRYVLTDHMRRCHGWKGATNSTTAVANGQHESKSLKQEHHSKLEC